MTGRKILGEVTRAAGKTIAVEVKRRLRHPKYLKSINARKTVLAHDEAGVAKVGDIVSVLESRPISKKKSWVLDKVEK